MKNLMRQELVSQRVVLPLYDSRFTERDAHVAQLVEHVLGKDEVTRSIRVVGSKQSLLNLRAHEVSVKGQGV